MSTSRVLRLLMVAVFVTSVAALDCYYCKEDGTPANDFDDCLNVYTCNDTDLPDGGSYEACTTYSYYTDQLYVLKGCYRSAVDTDEYSYEFCLSEQMDVYCHSDEDTWNCLDCCTTDLCNDAMSAVTMATCNLSGIVFGLVAYFLLFV
ncbi:uncharacterized protein LOC100371513 [Saccoglossus kowalevskii]|uniref:Uncharacterized protein LOC100371513 n=1 Tax=Saccoglossus kowalevskii TaxID=10224 RepID=A0ABM0GNE9_SACKO|nr:PREDICTED: uncharacterized protein LOC100371513 [Saccoglossus kowalevskii]